MWIGLLIAKILNFEVKWVYRISEFTVLIYGLPTSENLLLSTIKVFAFIITFYMQCTTSRTHPHIAKLEFSIPCPSLTLLTCHCSNTTFSVTSGKTRGAFGENPINDMRSLYDGRNLMYYSSVLKQTIVDFITKILCRLIILDSTFPINPNNAKQYSVFLNYNQLGYV